jgi:tetratricopeptide (TPR) repeat protein
MTFEIGFEDFDRELLPIDARDIGTEAFRRAVIEYYEREFAELGGRVVVDFGADRITVTWQTPGEKRELSDEALEYLQRGDLRRAVPVLKALVAVEPNNTIAHYNLGMALSDLGVFDEAQLHLLKTVHRDPENVNALVALGVALYRAGDAEAARRRLEQALALEPNNGYAHRNLAAILGNLGEQQRAIEHMREAYRLLPSDQASVYGLAHALEEFGGGDATEEADRLFTQAIDLDPNSNIGELAKRARSRIAQQSMRAKGGGIRMDAVMYILGALERFDTMRRDEVQAVGFEIAMLGQRGIDVNSPDTLYTLNSIPGEFTGLHLMSLMYTAFKQIAPNTDIGFDLSTEYDTALQMFTPKR